MALERFHFTGVDGLDYSLPKQIPSGALRAVRKLDNVDAAYTLLESAGDAATVAATDAMDAAAALKVINEWMQGLGPGESSGSAI